MITRSAVVSIVGLTLIAGCHSNKSSTSADAKSDVKCDAETVAAKPAADVKTATSVNEAAATTDVAKAFGAPQKLTAADAVPVSKVLADPAPYKNQYVRLTGKVSDVCPKKGCWVRIVPVDAKAGSDDIFIKFPDPPTGVYVPREAVGHNATVEGTLKVGQMSEKWARHFKEDAGAPAEEVAKIVGPQKQLMVAQPSVMIDGIEPPAIAKDAK